MCAALRKHCAAHRRSRDLVDVDESPRSAQGSKLKLGVEPDVAQGGLTSPVSKHEHQERLWVARRGRTGGDPLKATGPVRQSSSIPGSCLSVRSAQSMGMENELRESWTARKNDLRFSPSSSSSFLLQRQAASLENGDKDQIRTEEKRKEASRARRPRRQGCATSGSTPNLSLDPWAERGDGGN